MTDIVWVSYRKPDIIARGYWDQGLLERIMDRTVWRPVNALTFEHHDGFDTLPTGRGAVVVVPAQHHADVELVDRLNHDISSLPWCLLILTGDECSLFPWRALHHPNMRLWIMTPRREIHQQSGARFIGEGWHADTPDTLAAGTPNKTLDWFFAGQVTHPRRSQCARILQTLHDGELIQTEGFTLGLDRHDYLHRMAAAKVAPAPSGPGTPDSFRLYEALEAGALPIADARCPNRHNDRYWQLVYGDVPFPIIDDWADLPDVIDLALQAWPAPANRASAWWQQYKRQLAYDLDDDIRALTDTDAGGALADRITVIMPTSVIPSHPSTAVIVETIDSIRTQLGPNVEIIVTIDGLRDEQADRRDDYLEYQRRLVWATNHQMTNVVPVIVDSHVHQGNLARIALALVRTPGVLFCEHDTPLCGDIPWSRLADAIEERQANVIRLHHEASILEPHRHLMVDDTPHDIAGIPMLRTMQWSQRPHLAATDFYRRTISTYFGQQSRSMIEDVMHGVVDQAWREHGEAGWDDWRIWMYAPPGDMKRSLHLDGRGDAPKFDDRFVYAYDGPTPEGAPWPTAERTE